MFWCILAGVTDTILVVDDDADSRDELMEFLMNTGYRAVGAATAEDAVVRITAERPALILADLRMPHIDGIQLLRRMREASAVPRPFVYITAMPPSKTDELEAPVLRKPLDLKELLQVVGRICQK